MLELKVAGAPVIALPARALWGLQAGQVPLWGEPEWGRSVGGKIRRNQFSPSLWGETVRQIWTTEGALLPYATWRREQPKCGLASSWL